MDEKEKAKLGAESLNCFFSQFGEPDIYLTILLEVFMEELFSVSPISLFSESEQEGNQTNNDDFNEQNNEFQN